MMVNKSALFNFMFAWYFFPSWMLILHYMNNILGPSPIQQFIQRHGIVLSHLKPSIFTMFSKGIVPADFILAWKVQNPHRPTLTMDQKIWTAILEDWLYRVGSSLDEPLCVLGKQCNVKNPCQNLTIYCKLFQLVQLSQQTLHYCKHLSLHIRNRAKQSVRYFTQICVIKSYQERAFF